MAEPVIAGDVVIDSNGDLVPARWTTFARIAESHPIVSRTVDMMVDQLSQPRRMDYHEHEGEIGEYMNPRYHRRLALAERARQTRARRRVIGIALESGEAEEVIEMELRL